MGLENTNYNEVINNKLKKCEFCGRELEPIGFDYLYVNISPDCIDYKRCTCDKASYHRKVTDKTCCIHAEQRAIMNALRNHPEEIE